jgi:hypothetical protein
MSRSKEIFSEAKKITVKPMVQVLGEPELRRVLAEYAMNDFHQRVSVKWCTQADEVTFAEFWLIRCQITAKDESGNRCEFPLLMDEVIEVDAAHLIQLIGKKKESRLEFGDELQGLQRRVGHDNVVRGCKPLQKQFAHSLTWPKEKKSTA